MSWARSVVKKKFIFYCYLSIEDRKKFMVISATSQKRNNRRVALLSYKVWNQCYINATIKKNKPEVESSDFEYKEKTGHGCCGIFYEIRKPLTHKSVKTVDSQTKHNCRILWPRRVRGYIGCNCFTRAYCTSNLW